MELGGYSDGADPEALSEMTPAQKKTKKYTKMFMKDSHTDAVMALSMNHEHTQILASGSGDMTIKLWDLTLGSCTQTIKRHQDKVQILQWN